MRPTRAVQDSFAAMLTRWLDAHHGEWRREMAEGAQQGGQTECPCDLCAKTRRTLGFAGYIWEHKP